MSLTANDLATRLPVLPAWAKRIDRWEAATGVFVLAVLLSGHYLGGGIREYASQLVSMTIICELSMIWAAIGSAATSGAKNTVSLAGGIIFALGLYLFCVVVPKVEEFARSRARKR